MTWVSNKNEEKIHADSLFKLFIAYIREDLSE
jgi:hypothetical protein